jgi:hypothetical protein
VEIFPIHIICHQDVKEVDLKKNKKRAFPSWLFVILAITGLLASGIYIGIMSVEGLSGMRMVQSVGFGTLGLLMFLAALSEQGDAVEKRINSERN